MELLDALTRMEEIGRTGINISICCGPSGEDDRFIWSVWIMGPHGQESNHIPFEATSFTHCVEIAEMEIARMKWITCQ